MSAFAQIAQQWMQPGVPNMSADGEYDLSHIAGRLRQSRDKLSMSRADLAHVLGIDPETVSRWENKATSVPCHHLFPLADALGVDARWLATGVSNA